MDLTHSPAEEAFRLEARTWLKANVPREPLPSGDTAEGFALHRHWEKRLFEARWAVVSWPKAYGGREASLVEWLLFEEEYYLAGAPQRIAQNGIFLLAPTLFHFGTPEQQARLLPRMAAAEDLWAQGWSEPNAGSDLAGIQSRAVRDDARGGWRLSGQKAWCTRGAFCDWMFGLFRSDPAAERHRGLTYFLVPLRAQGVTVRPVGRLDGDAGFADVFLDDVFIPDRDVLGKVHDGWTVAMTTASSERGLTLRSPGRFVAAAGRLVDLCRRQESRTPGDPAHRDSVVRAWMDAEAYRLFTWQTVAKLEGGASLGAEASVNKVFWSEMDVRLHETAMRLLGPQAELAEGPWTKGFQFSLAGPIYAGTNEIQRNVIAERLLGLPEVAVVRFAFTPEALAIRDSVRALLVRECTPARVREAWSNADGRVPGLWGHLSALGVPGILAPEERGGLGLTELELVLVLEESGRFAMPEPIVDTAAVAVPLLREVEARELLQRVTGGAEVVVIGLAEAPFVVGADTADILLMEQSGEVHALERGSVRLEPHVSVDGSRRLFQVKWQPSRSSCLVYAERAARVLRQAHDRGAVAVAAQLIGLARTMLATTVDYVKARHQFGKPVGSFQAVKHHLADALIAIEMAAPVVYRAAYSLARGDAQASTHASMAKAMASDAAELVARQALQCHGAIGYAFENDLHLWMKRAWALSASWGDAASHRARVSRGLFEGSQAGGM